MHRATLLVGALMVSVAAGSGARADTLYYCDTTSLYAYDPATDTSTNLMAIPSSTGLSDSLYSDALFAAGSNRLRVIDVANRKVTDLGPFGGPSIAELAFDPARGVLYGTNGSKLYRIDTVTAIATEIGTFGTPRSMRALGFDVFTDALYGADVGTDFLYVIDTATGAATFVGDTEVAQPADLVSTTTFGSFGVGSSPDQMYSVSFADGQFTPIGTGLPSPPSGLAAIGNCTGIVVTPAALPGGYEGTSYYAKIQASGPSPGFTLAIVSGVLPPGLSFAPLTGEISGLPTMQGSYDIVVKATNSAGCAALAPYTIVIEDCAIAVTPTTLPHGAVGTPYSRTITANGGVPPYVFTIVGGALPPGLTFATTGVFSGTPTLPGTFGFTVSAADALCAGLRKYALVIDGATGVVANHVDGAGLGYPNPNQVKVWKANGTPAVTFLAYGAGAWGVNVATGDIAGGPPTQVLTGPGPGGVFGPQVRGFLDDGTGMGKVNFYAYGTLKFGVNPGAGRLDADVYAEVLTGAGPGSVFGPHVRAFDVDATNVAPIAKINLFAYGTLEWGVNVAGGDLDADGFAEILTAPGPGPSFGPQVRGFDYDGVRLDAIAKVNFVAYPGLDHGANVAGGDVDGDGFAEILAMPGPAPTNPSSLAGFDWDGGAVAALPGFALTLPVSSAYGGRIGAGDLTGDGSDDALAGAGREPGAESFVWPYAYSGGAMALLYSFEAQPGYAYGVNPTAGDLGY